MERSIVYPQELPRSLDWLLPQRYMLGALSNLAQVIFGQQPAVLGMNAAPTDPASLTVTIAPGVLFASLPTDATPYGSMAVDATIITKQGKLASQAQFTMAAPATSGEQIIYLIEATIVDQDTNAAVLPYFNQAQPSQPYQGPNGSGTAQPTVRQTVCTLQLKAGTAAPAATASAPSVDSGYIALYTIPINYGQNQITATQINAASGVQFFGGDYSAGGVSQGDLTSILATYVTLAQMTGGTFNAVLNNVTSKGLSTLSNYQELQGTVATSSTAGWTETINLANGTVQVITLNSSGTLAFSGVAPSGYACSVVLYLEQGSSGSALVTWPSGTMWSGGTAPTLSTAAGAIDVITLTTFNSGASWFGFVSGKGMAT